MREEKQIQSIYVDYHTYIIHRNPTFSCTNFFYLFLFINIKSLLAKRNCLVNCESNILIVFYLEKENLFEYQKKAIGVYFTVNSQLVKWMYFVPI